MSLLVEDGSGISGAESYISVADADTYHSNRGNAIWAGLTTLQKEQSLRKATDYMLGEYRNRWLGRRRFLPPGMGVSGPYQSLDWPRVGVVIEDFQSQAGIGMWSYGLFQIAFTIVPDEVKNACCELAVRAAVAPLTPDLTQKKLKTQVGPISVQYDSNSPQWVIFRQIEMSLRIYLIAGGNDNMASLTRS